LDRLAPRNKVRGVQYPGVGRRGPSNGPSLSSDLFGIDWATQLPFELTGGIRVELAAMQPTIEFAAAHYAAIFGSDASDRRFLVEALSPAKMRFLELSDRFMFRDGERAIGLLLGNPLDWSTYYWRSIAFLPEFQGRGLLAAALARTDAAMREAGVARLEGEAAPNNQRQLRLLSRLGYVVTGTINSERWGTLLRLTKYLRPEAEERFATQFCRDSFRQVD
jgi:RimJ/RimL family protein N-acetyltransferase